MTKILTGSAVLALFLALAGGAHLAVAAEVTGTLSSDGSTGTTSREASPKTVSGTAQTDLEDDTAVSGTVVAQNGNQNGELQGSVVQGRDETAASADASPWDAAAWLIPLAALGIVGLAYLLWRRGMV